MKSKKTAKKSKSPRGLFHVKVDVGNLPPRGAQNFLESISRGLRNNKAFAEHGDYFVSSYHGEVKGNVEIIRIV